MKKNKELQQTYIWRIWKKREEKNKRNDIMVLSVPVTIRHWYLFFFKEIRHWYLKSLFSLEFGHCLV